MATSRLAQMSSRARLFRPVPWLIDDPPNDRRRLRPLMGTAYLAADGFELPLAEELQLRGVAISRRHGHLFVTDHPGPPMVWAANTWFDTMTLPVRSIGDAAHQLRDIQRNWAVYAPVHRGRAALIAERLPHVSAKPLDWGSAAPTSPLGSWTLLAPNLVLASARCSSPFPNGEARFVEDRTGPPSRAYLKLWEALVRLGCQPGSDSVCVDLGASPGGWTWLLARLARRVVAVDKAPLAPAVAGLANVTCLAESAFGLDPDRIPGVDWVCSDVIAYPARLLALVERWRAAGVPNIVCTIKFQGETDHDAIRAFREIPGSQMFHLHHNKHELTFALVTPATG